MTDRPKPDGKPGRLGATLGGGAWTVGERVIAQISQLVIFITAARILSPAEFGVFSLVSACAILLLRTSEAGWAPYIMSWQGDDTVPRQVLMIAILSGLGAVPRLGEAMPGQLNTWAAGLFSTATEPAWAALGVSIGLIVAALAVAWLVFQRQEL